MHHSSRLVAIALLTVLGFVPGRAARGVTGDGTGTHRLVPRRRSRSTAAWTNPLGVARTRRAVKAKLCGCYPCVVDREEILRVRAPQGGAR